MQLVPDQWERGDNEIDMAFDSRKMKRRRFQSDCEMDAKWTVDDVTVTPSTATFRMNSWVIRWNLCLGSIRVAFNREMMSHQCH